jgi:hypothetical protein
MGDWIPGPVATTSPRLFSSLKLPFSLRRKHEEIEGQGMEGQTSTLKFGQPADVTDNKKGQRDLPLKTSLVAGARFELATFGL